MQQSPHDWQIREANSSSDAIKDTLNFYSNDVRGMDRNIFYIIGVIVVIVVVLKVLGLF